MCVLIEATVKSKQLLILEICTGRKITNIILRHV